MKLAPIILFVYNRPKHTLRTLQALSQAELASKSELYIFSDGPKVNASAEQRDNITEVRRVIQQTQWCEKVHIFESEQNKGLANSVISGVTDVLNKHGRAIVLEDDLIVSPTFLHYMNQALDYYESYDAVMSISSDYPQRLQPITSYSYDVFVSLRNFSYGWGTWKNKWDKVDWDMRDYETIAADPELIKAFNRGGCDLWGMLQAQRNHTIDSWAVRFTLAHFVTHSVTIMPTQSFIQHTGLDGSGTHCGAGMVLVEREVNTKKSFRFLPVIYEDPRWIDAFYQTYLPIKRPLWQRILNRIYKLFGNDTIN